MEDPFEPGPAVEASARYLSEQLARFNDVRLAVAAYNAGPGAVGGQVPHNGETEFYVAKVLAAYERLRPPPPPPRRSATRRAQGPAGASGPAIARAHQGNSAPSSR